MKYWCPTQADIPPDLQGEIDDGIRFIALCSGALLFNVVDVLRLAQDQCHPSHLHQSLRLRYRDRLSLRLPPLCLQESSGMHTREHLVLFLLY